MFPSGRRALRKATEEVPDHMDVEEEEEDDLLDEAVDNNIEDDKPVLEKGRSRASSASASVSRHGDQQASKAVASQESIEAPKANRSLRVVPKAAPSQLLVKTESKAQPARVSMSARLKEKEEDTDIVVEQDGTMAVTFTPKVKSSPGGGKRKKRGVNE